MVQLAFRLRAFRTSGAVQARIGLERHCYDDDHEPTRPPWPGSYTEEIEVYTAQLTAARPDALGAAMLLAAAGSTTAARRLADT